MTMLRVMVADDEPLARQLARKLLGSHADVVVAAECRDGDTLASALERADVDVLLLDVRMPGRDVFDVLDERAHAEPQAMPAVIFTTAYERYAVRAFELNAADYLVKPIAPGRFAQALARARLRIVDRAATAAGVARVARDLGQRPDRLLVPERGRMVPIAVEAIDWIQAEGDYARLHAGGKSYLVARSLTDLERRLDPRRFSRVHRSAIVNRDRIREVRPEGSRRHSLLLSDGTRLVLSRSRADRLSDWQL
ncbi:MAG TPA: LytTR family DNA-binding domain-containing protein [Vicinamibacterales bacterium]|nr:LytTR family DNA-binding domain-containing protein [Vicinamibacterales bacterium]